MLRNNSELSETVLSLTDALVVVMDAAGVVQLFNAACERASGFASAEALGRPLSAVMRGADRLLEETVSETELAGARRDGRPLRVVWRSRRVLVDGAPMVVAVGRDVTALRADEAALRDREARLDSFLNASRDGVITIREDGIVTSFSAGAKRLFGYDSSEVIGRNVSMLMPAPYAAAHDGYLADYRRTGDAKIIGLGREVSARRRDGSTFPIHLMVEEGRIGETRFFTGVVRDLSERHSLEQSLHEKEAQFETIFEAAPDPVLLVDAGNRILMANPAAASVFRSSTAELLGRPLAAFGAAETDRVNLASSGAPVGGTITLHVQFLRADGEAFPARVAVAQLHDGDGPHKGRVVIARDVSEERRREEALRQSQKMEAIGQLTGGMAHDFNNLLTVIKGNLELLEMTVAEDGARELIAEAHGAADMGASLTQRMLAFARRQSLKPQLVDVNALVVGLSDLLRRTLGERVRLSTSLEPRLPPVLVDPAQLQNAVLNLALNARDAMPCGGGVAIETHVHAEPDAALFAVAPQAEGGWVALTVSDTGKGIAPEIRERLFSPYATTKPAGQGGGLGLAMVFGFVTQSGGHIAVESEPGAGAAFTIYLPQAGERPVQTQRDAGPTQAVQAKGGETILLVEDNDGVRKLTSRRLKQLGYAVVEAEDGDAAIEAIARGQSFDLLLTDVVMPGALDGFALAAQARARRPGLRVLYTSGYVDPERMEEAEMPVGAELLRKPCSLAELAAAVRRALAN